MKALLHFEVHYDTKLHEWGSDLTIPPSGSSVKVTKGTTFDFESVAR
jgi:hypothetical protein